MKPLLSTTLIASLLALLALTTACGSDSTNPPDDTLGPVPAAPAENDPNFAVSRLKTWYLIGNAATPTQDRAEVQVVAPDSVSRIDAWIDGEHAAQLVASDGDFRQIIDLADMAAGNHELLLVADKGETAFASRTIKRSHPMYVVVTNDWDDPDNSEEALTLQQELHDNHPKLLLTHFVGPYTFTDEDVSDERRAYLVNWVRNMQETYGDEIGLHIHPYCSFVETTTVPCKTEPSFAYEDGDPTGYTVILSSYTEEEVGIMLEKADALFAANGLDKPTSFRAGGWAAEVSTLKALAANGFVADTSANNWARLEEWQGVRNGVLYEWNKEHWASIGDTSQPYYPSEADILVPGEPSVGILEVPDNGILVDYVDQWEMIEIFQANWNGEPLTAPVNYSIGYHPSNFDSGYQFRIDQTLNHVDRFLISRDGGPVIYATLSEMALVWPKE